MGLWRRNWKKLAEPRLRFDDDVVREFYANAWAEKQDRRQRKSMVRGKWISYSPQAIDDYLGSPFPIQEEECHYQRLSSKKKGFSNRKVATALCMPGKGYQIAASGKETRIRRGDMRTLSQVWLTFMLANVVPTSHVSDINVAKSNLLFSMIQDDYTVNIARIISDEIQKTVDWERVRGAERLGTLGFPSLITGLCVENGIIVDPKVKIRSSIDKKFIEHYCTHPDENPVQRNIPPSPQRSPSEPTVEEVEKRLMRHIQHIEDQNSALCRFMMQMYHANREKNYMDADELSSFLNWPGDRPSSVGEEEDHHEAQSTAGDQEKKEEEKMDEAGGKVAEEVAENIEIEENIETAKGNVGVVEEIGATPEVAKNNEEAATEEVREAAETKEKDDESDEETIAEMLKKKVIGAVRKNVNNTEVNAAEKISDNVAVRVPPKKKEYPGPPRRSFRIKTTVIKKGIQQRGATVPQAISSDSSSSSSEEEEEDKQVAENKDNGSDSEEEEDTPRGSC